MIFNHYLVAPLALFPVEPARLSRNPTHFPVNRKPNDDFQNFENAYTWYMEKSSNDNIDPSKESRRREAEWIFKNKRSKVRQIVNLYMQDLRREKSKVLKAEKKNAILRAKMELQQSERELQQNLKNPIDRELMLVLARRAKHRHDDDDLTTFVQDVSYTQITSSIIQRDGTLFTWDVPPPKTLDDCDILAVFQIEQTLPGGKSLSHEYLVVEAATCLHLLQMQKQAAVPQWSRTIPCRLNMLNCTCCN